MILIIVFLKNSLADPAQVCSFLHRPRLPHEPHTSNHRPILSVSSASCNSTKVYCCPGATTNREYLTVASVLPVLVHYFTIS